MSKLLPRVKENQPTNDAAENANNGSKQAIGYVETRGGIPVGKHSTRQPAKNRTDN